jgi:eukaryotic-like serine/threonine-protein kinase
MSDKQPDLDSLFQAALEIESSQQRAAFLAQSCGEDVSLRNEVERLLRSHEQAGSFLEQPAPELSATLLPDMAVQERAASLEAGLAAAFPARAAVVMGAANHSLLKALGKTIDLPRVVLREVAAEGRDPIVRPKSPEMPDRNSDSRYQLQGEIARGGMGAILKGRDTDLGRDLAIKVLLEEHKDKPDVIQRFVEEAQIGGQLQHPGIAPVYDLGQFADRRPYFSMKLVKGQTLAKLLANRQEASADRGKFLGMFAKVCETMAYAHSRGVIHRDLKPANIMVGAFGEVQVMDWGLAKVLQAGGVADEKKSRALQQGQSIIQTLRSGAGSDSPLTPGSLGSQTQMGSVMGTPAYMPPEQALGEIDNLDERADVFGLGAILCEILTGQPPYVGADATAVFRQASRGKLSDCLARLEACGADADLIMLTKHCLELEPKDRPRDASVLAERVSGYLQSVETKLRETELARVNTQVRSEELRRRQKLAFAAGAAIATSLVIGIAASVWQAVRADHEATRARSAEQRAVATLDELRASAPAFAEQARSLAARERFDEAIEKLDYALKLRPHAAEYLVAKADLLQCQLKLAEAAAIYREALRVKRGLARAEVSATLCDELLAAPPNADGKLTRENLARLHLAMQRQQRPAAELMPVARLLGEEQKLLVEYWLARLKDLPVSAEKPLKDRLTVREDGRLALDLSDTKVIDLSPLASAPLAVLNVSSSNEQSELTDLSPLRGLDLLELNISATSVADLSPLREMHTLAKLNVAGSNVIDLAALNALRLDDLNLTGTRTFDISALRGMKLKKLYLRGTRVVDLSPLAGMPLTFFDSTAIPAVDYSPLAGAPLKSCLIQNSPVTDLSFLQDSPVKELALFGCNELRGYSVLAGLKSLDLLVLPQSFRSLPEEELAAIGALRAHPTLKNIQTEYRSSGGWIINTTQSKDLFWQDWDREQTFVPALRKSGFRFSLSKLPTGSYSLYINHQPLRDISILKGAPISQLSLVSCQITDLTPLGDLPLEYLNIPSNPITDLSPLRGQQIKTLYLTNTKVSDLSPLTDMPLKALYLGNCEQLTDVGALAQIATLENVTVPIQAANIEALRKLPKLERLAYQLTDSAPYIPDQTAEEFWRENGPDTWISRLREAGIKAKTLARQSDGTWFVDLGGSAFANLTILKGAPISTLYLGNCPVSDLVPLRGMAIKRLAFPNTKVTDLSPLQGMPLNHLDLAVTDVTDLSAARGMPLTSLWLHDCPNLTDLSPLRESKTLTALTLPPNAGNIEFLRAFPKLERLSFKSKDFRPVQTAAEFWKEYDAKRK